MQRTSQLERGAAFAGYRIDELIGRGGMGMVYRATNVALGRVYALKVLAPELVDDERFQERFKREIRIAASIQHPHIVGIHYAGEFDGLWFLAMDYVHGTDLRELIRSNGALAPDRAVALLKQAASAIDAAHARGLVHRDVKPANILISLRDREEHAYLTDFGVAKRSETVAELTATGVLVGTVDYMAPEQITGGRADARTDIYALGCVFFQMLSGRVPYERDNSVAKIFAHVSEPPPSLDGPIASMYPAFAPVLQKALAKNPDDRHQSAGDLARDAVAALEGMRYLGPASVVAIGDAMPHPDGHMAPSAAEATQLEAPRSAPPGGQDATVTPATTTAPAVFPNPPTIQGPPPATPAHAGYPAAAMYGPGAPPYQQAPPSDRRSRRYKWTAIALVLIAIVGGGAAAAFILAGSSNSPKPATVAGIHPASHKATPRHTGSGTNQPTNGPSQSGGTSTPAQTPTNSTNNVAPNSTSGPAAVIRQHLDDIAHGHYQQAFALLSSGYQAANPTWVSNHASAGSRVTVVSIGAPTVAGGNANVPVVFFGRDRFATSASNTQCREFTGTAHLIKQGSVWRYDPVPGDLSATVVSASNPSCPA